MKNWLKILTGKGKVTAHDIQKEIENLKTEKSSVEEKLRETKDALDQAKIEAYGGGGEQSTVDSLEGELTSLRSQGEAIDLALRNLESKQADAIERERKEQIAVIDGQIQDLRKWSSDIRTEYARAKTVCDAYERLLSYPCMGVGTPQRVTLTWKEVAPYQEEVEKIMQGRQPIMTRIQELKSQRDILLKQ